MTQAKPGDTLQLHYKGTLEDGTVFDSSEGRDPLSFELGSGQIIPGLDAGVTGMEVGEKRTVQVEPEQAYGAHMPDRVQAVDRASVPDNIPTEPGTQLQVQTADGQALPVTVVEANDEQVVLDANHPLAGKTLTFDVELVEIA
ncbi:peptidylprolyl isomerase [Oceanicola sp. D3]|uniref:FKBP-type peptidyl-prolyl cis-trans isomerase n=1 Tax=Oceanicola sp. D3 TaxID=2587163 RepID=UPI0011217BCE|nr:peptidylprolyl isomerase [Oceanicola sp. D3]QDC09355.1 peptidylprolyl isomerase [Oceanicola sp. D3]